MKSEVLFVIWFDFVDFIVKVEVLRDVVEVMDIISVEMIVVGMGVVGGVCCSCYKVYCE